MPDDLKNLTRDKLDRAAKKAGVPDPEALPNKDAVLEAIEAPNPALVPEPEEPVAKTYTVSGPVPVFGHKPGDTFTAVIPAAQEARRIAAGHIKPKQED